LLTKSNTKPVKMYYSI